MRAWASGDEKLTNGRHILEVFRATSHFSAHSLIVSNIRTCPHRFLGSKVGAGIGAVFTVMELTPATRFLVVICDCGGRADGEEERPSCADGTTGVKYPSPQSSLPNHRNLLHSQSAHCCREIAPREELNRSTTRPQFLGLFSTDFLSKKSS